MSDRPDLDSSTDAQISRERPRVFGRGSWPEMRQVRNVLEDETAGGLLLVAAAALALVWSNSPLGDAYFELRDFRVGPDSLHLNLSLGQWAADGLLALFFFVAGLELKREFVAGDLKDPRRAALPIGAAVGGMVLPALIFIAINIGGAGGGVLRGWAVPIATDIAFALAVLAVVGSQLPTALRTFLLTLAIVDDLLAIAIIALVFTHDVDVLALALAIVPVAVFGLLAQRNVRSWWLMLPLAVVAWALVHASGIHATVVGVALAFTVPVAPPKSKSVGSGRERRGAEGDGEEEGYAEHCENKLRPLSAGVAVPIFAFLSAGVAVGGVAGIGDALTEPITLGIIVGLVAGKTLGVFGATWLIAKLTDAELDESLEWIDVLGLAMLAGVGFTVALLVGELAFGADTAHGEAAKVGVLLGSMLAATCAAMLLATRNRRYRQLAAAEAVDTDGDGVPDIYERL